MAYRGKFEAKYRGQRAAAPVAQRNSVPQASSGNARVPQRQAVREDPRMPAKPVRRGPTTGTVIFYTIYFLLIIGFFGGMFFVNDWLTGWLNDFEAKQPTTTSEEVFHTLFDDPDWADLYDRAGIEGTAYEGKEEFVAYMEARVGDAELTFQETSAGLGGGKKYFVKMDKETIGYFTLDDNRESLTAMPVWTLGEVSLNYSYDKSVTVQKMDGQTIFVNGIALTDEHTIQIGTILAEKYLPNGLHGPRIYTQYLTGLMCEPEVTAVDSAGNVVEVSYDEATGMYVAQSSVNTASEDQKTLAVNTAKAYSLRMIDRNHQMTKYFDTTSESYKAIMGTATFMQTWFYKGHEFGEATVSGYCRYSDTLYSVHVDMPMYVTRTDGSVREYNVDHTFFYEKQGGNWKCIIMTNVDVQQQLAQVRLTFVHDNAVLSSEFYDADTKSFTAPVVTAPEGKVFIGWFRESVDENGKKTMDLVFSPDADGNITVADGYELEPMTLVALFDNIKESEAAK